MRVNLKRQGRLVLLSVLLLLNTPLLLDAQDYVNPMRPVWSGEKARIASSENLKVCWFVLKSDAITKQAEATGMVLWVQAEMQERQPPTFSPRRSSGTRSLGSSRRILHVPVVQATRGRVAQCRVLHSQHILPKMQ